MKPVKTRNYQRVSTQVDHIRQLYSSIGEPLPADTVIDLHLHLAQALDLADADEKNAGARRARADRRPN